MLFYYIRHGDPIYSPDSLTPLGHRQAESVGKRLAAAGVKKIYASTSPRAIMTAQPLSELIKQEITLLDFANEGHAWDDFSMADDTGKRYWICAISRYRAFLRTDEVRALGFEWYRHPAFSLEDQQRFEKGTRRVAAENDALFESLGYRHDRTGHRFIPVAPHSERIALFAHAGFGHAFLADVLDLPYPQMDVMDMTHSGVTVLQFIESADGFVYPKIIRYSDTSHLYKDGLPVTQCNNFLV